MNHLTDVRLQLQFGGGLEGQIKLREPAKNMEKVDRSATWIDQ